jgi:hypothetical protein
VSWIRLIETGAGDEAIHLSPVENMLNWPDMRILLFIDLKSFHCQVFPVFYVLLRTKRAGRLAGKADIKAILSIKLKTSPAFRDVRA